MNSFIKSLKTGKAPGEDDIRLEMLKAMNMYGVCWLIRVCKVACVYRTGQAPKQWQTGVIIPIHNNKAPKALFTKLPGNPTVFAILFSFVTKLRKLGLIRWFDGINEEKKRITGRQVTPSAIVEVQ